MIKLRLWRLLLGKRLDQIAKEVRLPAYIVSAIERGEVALTPRWKQRFEEVYGPQAAAELLTPVDLSEVIGPATRDLLA